MRKGLLVALVGVLVVGMVCVGHAAGKVKLRLNLKKGQSYSMRFVTNQKITQSIQGQRQDVAQTVELGYTIDVEDVDAQGNATMRIAYDAVKFKMSGPMGVIEYDSSNPPDEIHPMAKGFAAFVGETFSITMTPQGGVKDVRGMEQVIMSMLDKLDLPEGPTRAAIEQNYRENFSNQALSEQWENMFEIYPEGPIGVGESWEKNVSLSTGFPMTVNTTYTLKERKKSKAIIGVHSTITTNPNAEPLAAGGMEMRYDIKGEQDGTMEMDETTGLTTSATLTQSFSGEIKVEPNPQMPEGMSWPVSMESTITIETL